MRDDNRIVLELIFVYFVCCIVFISTVDSETSMLFVPCVSCHISRLLCFL